MDHRRRIQGQQTFLTPGKNAKPIDPKAQAYFNKPAERCQLCGDPMDKNPDATIDKWQRKWSIHWECKDEMGSELDRKAGVKTERRGDPRWGNQS